MYEKNISKTEVTLKIPWFTHPVLFKSFSLPTVRKKDKAFNGSMLPLDDVSVPYISR